MFVDYLAALLQARSFAASRRGVLAGLTGGLFAAGPFALGGDDAEGRKNGKRQQRRKIRRKKKRKNRQQRPADPVTRADATCSGSDTVNLVGDDNRRFAQTFTAIASGSLVRAELSINKFEGSFGDYILHLGAVDALGVPTNDVLAFTSVANATVPAGQSSVSFSFANPATVAAGTQYALVLDRSGPDELLWAGQNGDLCGGQAFFSPDQTAPFVPFSAIVDLIFTTFVSS